MQAIINNATIEQNIEGRGLISMYDDTTNETLSIAHSFNFTNLASVEECMQLVATLCDEHGDPVAENAMQAVEFLAMTVLDMDKECQEGLVSKEDTERDICIAMWVIASLQNANWFEVHIDHECVRFYLMTAEEFAEREQVLAGKTELAA